MEVPWKLLEVAPFILCNFCATWWGRLNHARISWFVNIYISYLRMQPLHYVRDTGVIEAPPPSCTKVA